MRSTKNSILNKFKSFSVIKGLSQDFWSEKTGRAKARELTGRLLPHKQQEKKK